jgi:hypothetical protein
MLRTGSLRVPTAWKDRPKSSLSSAWLPLVVMSKAVRSSTLAFCGLMATVGVADAAGAFGTTTLCHVRPPVLEVNTRQLSWAALLEPATASLPGVWADSASPYR